MTLRERPLLEGRTAVALICSGAVLLLILPFTATFDEALTRGALAIGLARPLQAAAPAVAAQAAAILYLIGIKAASSGSDLTVWNAAGGPVPLFLSWNCLGWQAMILLGLSLVTGLSRDMSMEARLQVVLAGVCGTYLVNLLRILIVLVLAARVGYVPAILFHDYAGTLLTLSWLFTFWFGVQRWLIGPALPTAR